MKHPFTVMAFALLSLLFGLSVSAQEYCTNNAGDDIGPRGKTEILRSNGFFQLQRKGGIECGCSFVSECFENNDVVYNLTNLHLTLSTS